MRHISGERLNVLRTQYPHITAEKLHVCDTCHRARQKKFPFALSTFATKFLNCFIWTFRDHVLSFLCKVLDIILTIVNDLSRYKLLFRF